MAIKYHVGCKLSVLALSVPLLAACVTLNPQPAVVQGGAPANDGFLVASVAPGQSASCAGTPCQIYYQTPDLGGEITVMANGITVGTFPSNEAVSLGGYSDTTVRITVPGTRTPTAYVRMPNDSR